MISDTDCILFISDNITFEKITGYSNTERSNVFTMKITINVLILASLFSIVACANVASPGVLNILKHLKSNSGYDQHLARVPSLLSTLNGYDPIFGNPSAFPNPGFRSQIFSPFIIDNRGKIVISPFISQAHSNYNCEQEFTSHTSDNYDSYKTQKQSSISFSAEIGGSASASIKGIDVNAEVGLAFNSNKEEQKIESLYKAGKLSVSISTSECITHTVRLSSFALPTFTDGFKEGLLELQKAALLKERDGDSSEAVKKIFRQFITEFGTHYLKSTRLGTKIIFEKRFESRAFDKATENSRKKCVDFTAKATLGVGVGGVASADRSLSGGFEKCDGSSNSNKTGTNNSIETEKVVSIGSLLTSNENALFEDILKSVPIQFELDSIASLFRDEWLNPIKANRYRFRQLNGTLISNFLKYYIEQKYCLFILGKKCSISKGCGYNDDCKPNEICRDIDHSPYYSCQRRHGE